MGSAAGRTAASVVVVTASTAPSRTMIAASRANPIPS
jgi:hypothetical protein